MKSTLLKSVAQRVLFLASLAFFAGCVEPEDQPDPPPAPIDEWKQKDNFNGPGRGQAASFVIGDKLYVGTGLLSYDTFEKTNAAAFAIGNKGYLGTGETDALQKDFWEYDPATDRWVRKANFPGVARRQAAAFSAAGKGYLGTGTTDSDKLGDFWEYDPAADRWTQKASFPGSPQYGAGVFVMEEKGYLMGGSGISGSHGILWQYSPALNQWERKTAFQETFDGSSAFVIGQKAYVLKGSTDRFLEYDAVTNTWSTKGRFPGSPRVYPVSFAAGKKGYLVTGLNYTSTHTANELWEYTP
jgi:N-acetylneuraminic acid mutarotase